MDIQDIVDNPAETLNRELKDWQDLSNNVVRAKFARHIAALANHGGGYLVVGFDDNGKETEPRNIDPLSYSRDTVNAIVRRYLTPEFHCEVRFVHRAESNRPHPVIWVPGHGSVPICTRAAGPHDANGQPQGITIATYYTRKPGPRSEPVNSADDWKDIIRRCVVNERESLLTSINSIISGFQPSVEPQEDFLLNWHASSRERFSNCLNDAGAFKWPVNYAANHYELSYRIVNTENHVIPPNELIDLLERANQEIRQFVWTGWSMFYPFSPREIAPYHFPSLVAGNNVDILETNLIRREQRTTTLPDFWRFSGLGYASLFRAYREDRQVLDCQQPPLTPGEWMSPYTLARELAEFLRHALIISREFDQASTIQFFGHWVGLSDRRIDEFDPGRDWRERISRANERTVRAEWPVAELAADWTTPVSDVASKVSRLFDGLELEPQWVAAESRRFLEL